MSESSASTPPNWIDVDRLLSCIHCGLCLPSCPTHVISGEEMPSPRGRLYLMRAVQEGRLSADDPAFAEHEWSCLVCRACETACPSGVEFGYLMEQTRAMLQSTVHRTTVRDYIYTKLLPSRTQLRTLQATLAIATRLGLVSLMRSAGRALRNVTPRFAAMLRLAPRVSFPHKRKPEARHSHAVATAPRLRVALLLGCIGEAITGEINTATLRVLSWLGYEVIPIEQATCCGALSIHAGYRDAAIAMAGQMVDAALAIEPDFVVSNIAGCGAMLKDYIHLLPVSERTTAFRAKVRDITELLAENDLAAIARLAAPAVTRVAYQAPCHLQHAQKVTEAPLDILKSLHNVVVEPLAENHLCCGSAGSYNIEHPIEAEALLLRKLTSIEEQQPEIMITANSGCLLQLQKGIREARRSTRVLHIVEFLDQLLPATAR